MSLLRPDIFAYMDHKSFLADMYEYKRSMNPKYSKNAFLMAAGYGENSRGYFNLLISGKRKLTNQSIVLFSKAMNLTPKEAIFFENLVLFSQSEDDHSKLFYYERMKYGAEGIEAPLVEVLGSQYRFLNEWHLIVLRELINLKDFKECPEWIEHKLDFRVGQEKIKEGIQDLINLGFVSREKNGHLSLVDSVILFKENQANFKNTTGVHKNFCKLASLSLERDDYQDRAAQILTLTLPKGKFEDMRKEIQDVTAKILKKYGNFKKHESEEVIQLGMQLVKVAK